MAEVKQVQARIKQEYKRESMTLLSGVGFSKHAWIIVPKEKVAEARAELSEILDFREVGSDAPPVESTPMAQAVQQLDDREAELHAEDEIIPSETGENAPEEAPFPEFPEKKRIRRKKKDLD